MAKCCTSSFPSLLNCCSDNQDRHSEETVPVVKLTPQMQKPTKEQMPHPEDEDEDRRLQAARDMNLSGATASMGVRYIVVLDGSAERQFGLEFELIDPLNCLIGAVNDAGQVAAWNMSAPYHERVRRFDCLRRVNGKTAPSKELVETLVTCRGEVELELERPTAIEVEIKRSGRKLGLVVAPSKLNLGLVVRGVEDSGAIARYNRTDGVDYVKASDRLVAIDGQFLTPSALAQSLLPDQYKLTIYRYFSEL